jgi:hypothetical protein
MKETLKSIAAGIDHAIRRVHFDVNPDPRATTFVAGTGRSGTAWAANIANYDQSARYMFEPFNPYKVPICAGFRYRQYLRPDDVDPRYVDPACAIVTGRVKNDWIDQFNRRVVSRSRVIKEIRANLLLKWLKCRFPDIRLVLMLRHPCADANSRLHLGWQSHLDEMLGQPDLIEDHLAPFAAAMLAAETQFEKHVFLWCVENYVALRQLSRDDAHLIFYENLCEHPKREVEALFAFLGRKVTPDVFYRLAQPSELSREESAIVQGGSLVDSWRRQVSPEMIAAAMRILALFGLDAIYSAESSMPDVEAAVSMLAGKAPSPVGSKTEERSTTTTC